MELLKKDIHVIIQDLKDAGYTEMIETYETLENTYNHKITNIDKLQREYEASIRTKAKSQESIARINYKIASLKDREKNRNNYYSMNGRKSRSTRGSTRKLISYYKKLLKSFKRRNKMAKISERNLKKIIDKKLKDMKTLKKDLKSYERTIRREYRSQKDAIKFIKEYNINSKLIDKSCSKEVKVVLKKCIENMRNGEELPYNLTINQLTHEFKLIKDCALKNEPIPQYMEITAAAEQYKEELEERTKRKSKKKTQDTASQDDISQSIDKADILDPNQYNINAKPIVNSDENDISQSINEADVLDPSLYNINAEPITSNDNKEAKTLAETIKSVEPSQEFKIYNSDKYKFDEYKLSGIDKDSSKEKNHKSQAKQKSDKISSKKRSNFVKGAKDWSANAFDHYHIDRNKLEKAIQNTKIKDPVKFATALGKMSIENNQNINSASEQMLLDRGLQILESAINGDEPKTMTMAEAKAYKQAHTLIALSPDIRMDYYLENDDKTQTHNQAQDRG